MKTSALCQSDAGGGRNAVDMMLNNCGNALYFRGSHQNSDNRAR
jgi:hypothetical protein